jgi:hypothetical protein
MVQEMREEFRGSDGNEYFLNRYKSILFYIVTYPRFRGQ